MTREIEMKAWVDDPDSLLAQLDSRYEFIRTYQKSDLYLVGEPTGSGPPPQMRIREDDGEWMVTFKDKTRHQGMEVNQEEEYPLKDPQVVERVARRLGWQEYIRKTKHGRQYRDGRALYEVSLVEPLGWFLEIEILLEDDEATEESIRETEGEIRQRFRALKIDDDRVESRYFTEMILEARRRDSSRG